MSYLKSLTFTLAPHQIERNPKLLRRQRLIERLEEQIKLAADPTFTFSMPFTFIAHTPTPCFYIEDMARVFKVLFEISHDPGDSHERWRGH
jgi:hypothetical protein